MALKLNPRTGQYEDDGTPDPNNPNPNGPISGTPDSAGRPGTVPGVPTLDTAFGTPTGDPNADYTSGSPYFNNGDDSKNPLFPNAPYVGGSVNTHTPNPNLPAAPPAAPADPTTPAPPATTATTTDPGAGGSGTGGAPGPAAPAATASHDPSMDDMVRTQIMKLLNPQPIDAASLLASPEAAAERLQNQRSTERQIANQAELAAYGGLFGSGGEEGVLRGMREKQGETDTAFIGQLAQQKTQQQIDELKFGIQTAVQMGQFDKAQSLSRELAQLQASTSSGNTAMQVGLGYAQLQQQANQEAVLAALGLGG